MCVEPRGNLLFRRVEKSQHQIMAIFDCFHIIHYHNREIRIIHLNDAHPLSLVISVTSRQPRPPKLALTAIFYLCN